MTHHARNTRSNILPYPRSYATCVHARSLSLSLNTLPLEEGSGCHELPQNTRHTRPSREHRETALHTSFAHLRGIAAIVWVGVGGGIAVSIACSST